MEKNKQFHVVVGLGKTGLSCVRHLIKKGAPVAVTDDRAIPPSLHELRTNFPNVPVYVGRYAKEVLAKADVLVISPGVPLKHPLIQEQIDRGVSISGDIELFALEANAPIIAITGSNGKSTVTTLVGLMAKEAGLHVQVGGNLGKSALDLLCEKKVVLYVLELSSFQLETTKSLNALTATVLNVSPDHLDRYTNFDHYVSVKQRIYQMCDIPVFNREDARSVLDVTLPDKKISFGLDQPSKNTFGLLREQDKTYFAKGKIKLLATENIAPKGSHQWANVLAAFALGDAVGLPMPAMIKAAQSFSGLPHRCQWVGHYANVDWYNDSKATNVGAACAAIEGIGQISQGKLILIAGGLGKQADFSDLRKPVSSHVKTVILLGKDAEKLGASLEGSTNILYAKDMREAVVLSNEHIAMGDVVLLSPACASFDMFEGFDKRGDVFMSTVRDFYE